MPFPETPRVIYHKNPLKEVICQLRFPPILRIESSPADFQDLVRDEFPEVAQSFELLAMAPPPQVARIPTEIAAQISHQTRVINYEFATADRKWKINLTRNFVSLSTNNYHRWETFREKLAIPFQALIRVYNPHRFSRIGLRYVDVIHRSQLALDDIPWSELLEPHLLGFLGNPDVRDSVRTSQSSYELALENREDRVRIVTSLHQNQQRGEKCYLIDSDFFTLQPVSPSLEAAMDKLDYFNARASRLIRWCITDKLHEAMEPTAI